ncbi:MAG TPA: ribosome biogenesis GTP-binding protein YihA/YsxC [Polyangiaceae bacterium]|nr:ribosome biogenesis GTP-binding protein YihA/YsxC [Polyangiaceae bacterium]
MKPELRIVEASFVAGVAEQDQLPPPALAEIAFAGRSNVGKSSLLNTLVGRKNLVRTGSTPGTTRQLNLFHVRAADGLEAVLVDLPGYGFAKRAKHEKSRWGALIEGYLSKRVTLRAVVLLVDVRRGPEHEEKELVTYVESTQGKASRPKVPIIMVATKIDKIPRAQRKPALARLAADAGCRVVGFSAETGEGKEELWGLLRGRLVMGTPSPPDVGDLPQLA